MSTHGGDTGESAAPPKAALRIGASSWSAPSWEGVFYPRGAPPGEYLAHYATRFDTVEIDATFYRIPAARVVDGWRERTPPGFLFAAKFPQAITHEKLLEGCREDLAEFLRVMERLGDKLGPLLLQFRYFRKAEFPDPGPFLDRLERFLPLLPRGRRFAVEVRNRSFLTPRLAEILARHGVALALIDHPWFPPIGRLARRPDLLTADFVYVRWLGDRRAIEERTVSWDRLIVDRSREMAAWIPALRALLGRGLAVFGYFNNHYAGYAVGSIEMFRDLWDRTSRDPSPQSDFFMR